MSSNDETCVCDHDLGVHIPDPNRPFAWPCRLCSCRAYKKKQTSFADIALELGISEDQVRQILTSPA